MRNSNSLGRVAASTASRAKLNSKLANHQAMVTGSDTKSNASGAAGLSQKLRKSKAPVKMVRVEQMFESDVRMANAYGGEA